MKNTKMCYSGEHNMNRAAWIVNLNTPFNPSSYSPLYIYISVGKLSCDASYPLPLAHSSTFFTCFLLNSMSQTASQFFNKPWTTNTDLICGRGLRIHSPIFLLKILDLKQTWKYSGDWHNITIQTLIPGLWLQSF